MLGVKILAAISTLGFPSGGAVADDVRLIEANYRAMSGSYRRKDAGGFMAHFSAAVEFRTPGREPALREELSEGLRDLFRSAEELSMHYQFRSWIAGRDRVVATVRAARQVLLRNSKERFVRDSVTEIRHTWQRERGAWKIARIEFLGTPDYGRRRQIGTFNNWM